MKNVHSLKQKIIRKRKKMNETEVWKTRWDVCISSYQFWQAADHRLLLKYGKGFSLSLSLSLTHSHTHTQTLSLSHLKPWDGKDGKVSTFQSLFPNQRWIGVGVGVGFRSFARTWQNFKLCFLIAEKSIQTFPEFPGKKFGFSSLGQHRTFMTTFSETLLWKSQES